MAPTARIENFSWNCGAEGLSTHDPAIRALRARQMRNLMATLLFSAGTPMLRAGDELGHSQSGNNNPYCQDNADQLDRLGFARSGIRGVCQRRAASTQGHPGFARRRAAVVFAAGRRHDA